MSFLKLLLGGKQAVLDVPGLDPPFHRRVAKLGKPQPHHLVAPIGCCTRLGNTPRDNCLALNGSVGFIQDASVCLEFGRELVDKGLAARMCHFNMNMR